MPDLDTPTAPAQVAPGRVASWLRSQRIKAGLSQQAVADAARELGANLSRSHLSNLELGVYPLAPQHVVVLDTILNGRGELISLVEDEWGRTTAPLPQSDWVKLGESIHDFLGGDHAGPDLVDEHNTRLWWANQPDGDAVVVEGRAEVENLVHVLLSMAARDFVPRIKGPIEFTGMFEGFRDDDRHAGFPLSVRHALRSALERGWRCRHYIPVRPDDTDKAALVYVAAALMPCPNYTPLLVDPQVAPTLESFLVIPGLAAAQFIATGTARHVDAAIVYKGDHATRVIQQRIRRIDALSKEFVLRRDRTVRKGPDATEDELEQKKALAYAERIPGPSRHLLTRWPSVTIAPKLYAELIEARKQTASSTDCAVWDEVTEYHSRRFDAFRENLGNGHPFQLILPESAFLLSGGDAENGELDREQRRRQFAFVLEELLPNDRFEVAIAPDKWAKRIEQCRWAVHERASGSGGVVSVQTFYTPPLDGFHVRQNRELRVDLTIEAPGAVRAFSAYFAHIWKESDAQGARERLETAVDGRSLAE